jgi:hypothetical protein
MATEMHLKIDRHMGTVAEKRNQTGEWLKLEELITMGRSLSGMSGMSGMSRRRSFFWELLLTGILVKVAEYILSGGGGVVMRTR